MSKQKRGKVLKVQKNWRGTCPLCNRPRVKLVWPEDGTKGARMICKACYAKVSRP